MNNVIIKWLRSFLDHFIFVGEFMKKTYLRKTVLSALFLAIGAVLPLLTSQIKEIGDTLLPMHIPVMLCGLICGPFYGLSVGLILPFFRSLTFGMPPFYPNAVWMSAELAAYGFLIGFTYLRFKNPKLLQVYISLLVSMLGGRIVWGLVKTLLLGLGGNSFTLAAFATGGFLDAIPGIILQLVLIPFIFRLYQKISK